MKKKLILGADAARKPIKNTRDGYHLNSKYWQDWKNKLPLLPKELKEIAIGMILSDACMYKVSTNALIKFEQGYQQEEFLKHLFDVFKDYCFMLEPGKRIELNGIRKGLTKSFWFKTFSHPSFTEIWNIFYNNTSASHKKIQENLIIDHLTNRGLAYWIMGDGSLQKDRKTMILHTQSYSEYENKILSKELNQKFGFHSKVISHKNKYFVIKLEPQDCFNLKNIIESDIIESMAYKIPKT